MKISDLNYKVILAGGNTAQSKLFEYLIYYSFKPELNLKDFRIGQSLISLFPPQYHAWLALIFWQAEWEINDLYNTGFSSCIYNPWKILNLHHGLNSIPYGDFLIPYLNQNKPKSTLELQRLMNLNYDGLISDSKDYQDKLERLLGNSNNANLMKELIAENNRPKTAYILAKWLGYADSSITNITRFFEQWSYNL